MHDASEHGHSGREDGGAPKAVRSNVETIARLERDARRLRSPAERVSDACVHAMGSMPCLLAHVALFAGWVLVNTGRGGPLPVFDPFPFGILTLLVSTEAVFLAIFVLISQNRMARAADRRAHLDLQVSLLAERELTALLHLQRRVCAHLGIPADLDDATAELADETSVQGVAGAIEDTLPDP